MNYQLNTILNLTEKEYRQAPGLSQSMLKEFATSAYAAKYSIEHKSEPTPSMQVGTWLHLAILEPEQFESTCVQEISNVQPNGEILNRNTNKWKDLKALFELNNRGKEIIPFEDFETICRIRKLAIEHQDLRRILTDSKKEQSIFFNSESGILCKARADILTNKAVIDLKKTKEEPSKFHYAISQFEMKVQAAFYCKAFDRKSFAFVSLPWHQPHEIGIHQMSHMDIHEGHERAKVLIERYVSAIETNVWPRFTDGTYDVNDLL